MDRTAYIWLRSLVFFLGVMAGLWILENKIEKLLEVCGG